MYDKESKTSGARSFSLFIVTLHLFRMSVLDVPLTLLRGLLSFLFNLLCTFIRYA